MTLIPAKRLRLIFNQGVLETFSLKLLIAEHLAHWPGSHSRPFA